MYAEEQNGKETMEVEGSVQLFFLSPSEEAIVNLEDGRYIGIDMHGNFTVRDSEDRVIQSGAFSG